MLRRHVPHPAVRPATASQPSLRSGKSLIELVAVVSIMAVVMAAGARLMHALFRAERTGTRKVAETVALAQLGRAFRHDAHAAASADFVPSRSGDGEALKLVLPDGPSVFYVPEDDRVVRRLMRGDQPESQQTFFLPDRSIRFEGEPGRDDAGQGSVTLVCEPVPDTASPNPSASARLPVRIVAAVGRDYRLARMKP